MAHQFYIKQRVIVKEGKKSFRGFVANYDESINCFEVQTDFGHKYMAQADRLEPDYGMAGQRATALV